MHIRLAQTSECDLLFKWARSKRNSKVNFLSKKKTLKEHREWFKWTRSRHKCLHENCEDCPTRLDILIGFRNNKPMGVVTCAYDGELEIFMCPYYHYKGLGRDLLWCCVDWLAVNRKIKHKGEPLEYLYANCVSVASKRLFDKAGFIQMPCGDYAMDL